MRAGRQAVQGRESGSVFEGPNGRWFAVFAVGAQEGRASLRYVSARTRRRALATRWRAEQADLRKWSPALRPGRGAPAQGPPRRHREGAHRSRPIRRVRPYGRRLAPVIGIVSVSAAVVVTVAFAQSGPARSGRLTSPSQAQATGPDLTKPPATRASSVTTPTSQPAGNLVESKAPVNPLATTAVTSYLAGQPGTITAAVYNLDNGQIYQYNPTDDETTASTIKVDILATLLYQDQVRGAALSPQDQELATTMIENSNDNAAQDLWDQVGANVGVGHFDTLVGLTGTTLDGQGLWGLSTTTAADQVKVLSEVVQSQSLLNPASRQYELGLMENVEADQRWGVAFGVPAGVTVAIKDGWDPLEHGSIWQVNTEGWVDGAGRDYLLAILTKGESTEYAGITTVDNLSALIWKELAPTAAQ
jgi:beta-lactamase class A